MPSSILNSDDGLVSGTSGIKTTGGDDGVLNIQSNGTTVAAVNGSGVAVTGTLSASGGYGAVSATTLTVNSNNISADNSLGFRNRIINGDMRIDQRNAGAAVTASGAFPVDRFAVFNITDGAFSAQQDSSAPTGFVNSVKFTTTTADGTLATTQTANVLQTIEGTNIADLGWGTANAKTVTLSFWVRSSLTGTFGGSLRNDGANRSYPFTYVISVADTWEYKTVTIAGDTSGTWLTTTGRGISVIFALGAGSDRSGTAGAWNSNNNTSATGAVSVIGTLNATWYITGVQLEVGSVATPFERRDYGRELDLCQRYAFRYSADGSINNFAPFGLARYYGTNAVQLFIKFPCTMRTSPTSLAQVGNIFVNNTGFGGAALTSIVLNEAAADGATVTGATTTGTTDGNATTVYADNTSNAALIFSAEL